MTQVVRYDNRYYTYDDADTEYDGVYHGSYFVDDPSDVTGIRPGRSHTTWHDDNAGK